MRHSNIHDNHIRLEGYSSFHAQISILCHPNNFKLRLARERMFQSNPHHGVIFDNQNS
jgi:hypothetical protein